MTAFVECTFLMPLDTETVVIICVCRDDMLETQVRRCDIVLNYRGICTYLHRCMHDTLHSHYYERASWENLCFCVCTCMCACVCCVRVCVCTCMCVCMCDTFQRYV